MTDSNKTDNEPRSGLSDLTVGLGMLRDKIREDLQAGKLPKIHEQTLRDCRDAMINALACIEWLEKHYSERYA
jgi:hypothetical protein